MLGGVVHEVLQVLFGFQLPVNVVPQHLGLSVWMFFENSFCCFLDDGWHTSFRLGLVFWAPRATLIDPEFHLNL